MTRGRWTKPGVTPGLLIGILVVSTVPPCRSQAQTAAPSIRSVVNAASFGPGLPSGGALATILIDNLTGPQGTRVNPFSPPLPWTSYPNVWVNNAPAPILFVYIPAPGQTGPAQINFQVPLERNGTYNYPLSSPAAPDNFAISIPKLGLTFTGPYGNDPGTVGIFADAGGYAIAFDTSDNSVINAQSPAHPGDTVTLYVDDLFRSWPPPPIATPVPQQPSFPQDTDFPVLVTVSLFLGNLPDPCCTGPYSYYVGDTKLQIASPQLAPGLVGVEQVNFTVPADQPPGDYALFFYDDTCNPNYIFGCPGAPRPVKQYVKLPVR